MIKIFHAPKTSGASLLSLNFSVAHAHFNLDQKVALLEVSESNHQSILTHTQTGKDWGDLSAFIKNKEWSAELFNQFPNYFNVTLLSSPTFNQDSFDLDLFKPLWEKMTQHFDVVFLDLGKNIPANLHQFLIKEAHEIYLVSNTDPLSLQSLEAWQAQHPELERKVKICFNQCEKNDLQNLKNKKNIFTTLPKDPKACSYQVYEGLPIVGQKRSPLRKVIENLYKNNV